jgi:hypothetical protein
MTNSNNWYEEMKVLVESNSRAIQAMADDTTLKRLEAIVESNSRAIQAKADDTTLKRLEAIVESNSRAIQAMADDTTLKRLEAIVESNSRSIQAMADDTAALKLSFDIRDEKERQGMEELRQAMLGIANLVSSLDEDRPTILRKLNSIENKVDRILEQGTED